MYNPSAEIRGRVYCKRDDRHTDSRQTRQYHAGPGTKSQLCKIPGSGCGILCVASTSIPEQRRDVTRNMTQDKDQEERKRLEAVIKLEFGIKTRMVTSGFGRDLILAHLIDRSESILMIPQD